MYFVNQFRLHSNMGIFVIVFKNAIVLTVVKTNLGNTLVMLGLYVTLDSFKSFR